MTAIIRAAPGYSVLSLAGEHVGVDPIIAWLIFADARRTPVTVGEDRTPPWTIERADGVVDTPARTFADRRAWLDTLLAERARAAAPASAAP
jgi:hypothetical protein